MPKATGERIVVDSRPGASGVIGSYLLSNATPDGQTLLTASSDTHTIYPHFFNNPKFRPEKHVPIATLAFVPFALAVNRNLPVNNLHEFIELCKKRTVSYSTWGIGTTGHAAMLAFMRSAGIPDMLHVEHNGMVEDVAGHDGFVATTLNMHRYMTRRMSTRVLDPDAVR